MAYLEFRQEVDIEREIELTVYDRHGNDLSVSSEDVSEDSIDIHLDGQLGVDPDEVSFELKSLDGYSANLNSDNIIEGIDGEMDSDGDAQIEVSLTEEASHLLSDGHKAMDALKGVWEALKDTPMVQQIIDDAVRSRVSKEIAERKQHDEDVLIKRVPDWWFGFCLRASVKAAHLPTFTHPMERAIAMLPTELAAPYTSAVLDVNYEYEGYSLTRKAKCEAALIYRNICLLNGELPGVLKLNAHMQQMAIEIGGMWDNFLAEVDISYPGTVRALRLLREYHIAKEWRDNGREVIEIPPVSPRIDVVEEANGQKED